MYECNVVRLNIELSQGSAATEFRCGGRFYLTVFRSLSANPKVKELLKSVHICQSYRKNKSGTFFMAHGVEYCQHILSPYLLPNSNKRKRCCHKKTCDATEINC